MTTTAEQRYVQNSGHVRSKTVSLKGGFLRDHHIEVAGIRLSTTVPEGGDLCVTVLADGDELMRQRVDAPGWAALQVAAHVRDTQLAVEPPLWDGDTDGYWRLRQITSEWPMVVPIAGHLLRNLGAADLESGPGFWLSFPGTSPAMKRVVSVELGLALVLSDWSVLDISVLSPAGR